MNQFLLCKIKSASDHCLSKCPIFISILPPFFDNRMLPRQKDATLLAAARQIFQLFVNLDPLGLKLNANNVLLFLNIPIDQFKPIK